MISSRFAAINSWSMTGSEDGIGDRRQRLFKRAQAGERQNVWRESPLFGDGRARAADPARSNPRGRMTSFPMAALPGPRSVFFGLFLSRSLRRDRLGSLK